MIRLCICVFVSFSFTTYCGFSPHRSPGQAVVTGVVPPPHPGTSPLFFTRIGPDSIFLLVVRFIDTLYTVVEFIFHLLHSDTIRHSLTHIVLFFGVRK